MKKRVAKKRFKGWDFPRGQTRGFVISSLRGVIQSSRKPIHSYVTLDNWPMKGK